MCAEFLRKITDKYKEKTLYDEEVQEIVNDILCNYLKSCAKYAAEGKNKAPIYCFRIETLFKGIRIVSLIPKIINLLSQKTDVKILYEEYIVKINGKVYVETEPSKLDLSPFKDDNFFQVCFIYAEW